MATEDTMLENVDFVVSRNMANFILKNANVPVNKSGLCCDCEEPIDPRRLAVQPTAMRCIECGTEHDNQQRYNQQLYGTRGVIQNMDI